MAWLPIRSTICSGEIVVGLSVLLREEASFFHMSVKAEKVGTCLFVSDTDKSEGISQVGHGDSLWYGG